MDRIGCFLLFALFSLTSSCSFPDDVLEETFISIQNSLSQNGVWETNVKNLLNPSFSSANPNVDLIRKVVQENGKKRIFVTVFLKGNFNQFSYGPLRFHSEGARNIKVSDGGKHVTKFNTAEEGWGGVLTNRPLQDNELFEVRIDKLISTYSTSLGVGITRHDLATTEYARWMADGTKMLYNYQVYEEGTVTNKNYGPNLRELKVGDRVGVMKKSNGELHFFVNGGDLGAAAYGIAYPVYGVLDLFGNAVEATIL